MVNSPGPVKYIACNCEEGDPGAFNDKAILESDPHTLLEGMILAGYATGATNATFSSGTATTALSTARNRASRTHMPKTSSEKHPRKRIQL